MHLETDNKMAVQVFGSPQKITRSYVYQFAANNSDQKPKRDVIFTDKYYGFMYANPDVGGGVMLEVPTTHCSNRGFKVVSYEQIKIANLDDDDLINVSIEYYDGKANLKTTVFYQKGDDIIHNIKMDPKSPDSPYIWAGTTVKDIYYEFLDSGLYLAVNFERFLPILQPDGTVKEELFSHSCYEIESVNAL
jgi:hypothetical protein